MSRRACATARLLTEYEATTQVYAPERIRHVANGPADVIRRSKGRRRRGTTSGPPFAVGCPHDDDVLFHHAQGQTTGFLAFADELREAGHTVHAPDLYDGRTFDDLDGGIGYAKEVGFGEVLRRGTAAAEDLPTDIVYAGFSLGVMPAQSLAQTRPGARGRSSTPRPSRHPSSKARGRRGCPWRSTLMDSDPWGEEDRPAAEALVAEAGGAAKLFLYPGSGHLFADSSLNDYDEQASGLLKERTLAFLGRVG